LIYDRDTGSSLARQNRRRPIHYNSNGPQLGIQMIIRQSSSKLALCLAGRIYGMTQDRKIAQKYAVPSGPRDLVSHYREIGMSAVPAALKAPAGKPQKPLRTLVAASTARPIDSLFELSPRRRRSTDPGESPLVGSIASVRDGQT